MTKISSFENFKTSNFAYSPADQTQKDKKEKAATIVGGAGFATTANKYAKGYASRRGLANGESTLQKMLEATTRTARQSSKIAKESGSLIAKFKANVKIYTADAIRMISKLQDNKIIGAIVKNPLMKKVASGFGVVMAFFVLVTSLTKAVENGNLAINDAKEKYHEMRYM